ncbi:MAG: hypothetical protein OXF62_14340 [Caldilineaceae bacterium]|nr:hypothetical protein [Caldilineaceae bacterium]
MNLTDLALVGYYIADSLGWNGVDNQQMVNFLARIGEDGGLDTQRFSNDIQRPLRSGDAQSPKYIVSIVERTGGPEGQRGVWQITDQGRARAENLLTNLFD